MKSILLSKMRSSTQTVYEVRTTEDEFFAEFEKQAEKSGLGIRGFYLTRKYDGTICVDHTSRVVGYVNLRGEKCQLRYFKNDFEFEDLNELSFDEALKYTQCWLGYVQNRLADLADLGITDYEDADTHLAHLDELNRNYREQSDRLYEERQKQITAFDPYKPLSLDLLPEPLKSTEKYFLRQIAGQPVAHPTVHGYWIYEYSVDFSVIMTKLLSMHYLGIGGQERVIAGLTVPELKKVLAHFDLSVSGKKAELSDRIYANIDPLKLEEYFADKPKFYYLTERGEQALLGLQDSATKDTEFEDNCLKLISMGDINGAYQCVCKRESEKRFPRGLGIDWEFELRKGLPDYNISKYCNFLQADLSSSIPNELLENESQLKACCILAILLGTTADKIAKTFIRITGKNTIESSTLVSTLQSFQFMLMDDFQKHNLKELSSQSPERSNATTDSASTKSVNTAPIPQQKSKAGMIFLIIFILAAIAIPIGFLNETKDKVSDSGAVSSGKAQNKSNGLLTEVMELDADQEAAMLEVFAECGIGEVKSVELFQKGEQRTSYYVEDDETIHYNGADSVIVVWIGNTSRSVKAIYYNDETIYENGKVKAQLSDFYVPYELVEDYRTATQMLINECLQYSKTAKYGAKSKWSVGVIDGLDVLQSTVKAKNAFGMENEMKFTVKFDRKTQAPVSIILDGEEMIKK